MIVGLTGGIGSGKSKVAHMLAQRGAVIVDTDLIAREVVQPPNPVLDRIVEAFGPAIVDESGALDRDALAKIIFADEDERRRLNEIVHPEILKRVLARIGRFAPATIVVVVVPLLFESGFDRNCHAVVAVTAPDEQRVERVMRRDGVSEADVRARMRAQLPESEYASRRALIVRNDGDEAALEREVDALWSRLKGASERNA